MCRSLGCIADDFTGATDLANNLVRTGMPVVQTIGVPAGPLAAKVDAVVVALKSRTIAPAKAVAQAARSAALAAGTGSAADLLQYCCSFDSTPAGNIGPVTEALMAAMPASASASASNGTKTRSAGLPPGC